MAMAKFTVDTTSKLFIAKAGVTSFDVKIDLYSDGKEHWLTDATANKFDFPIRTIGGDSIGGGQFAGDLYFLRDGWKLRPDEADHTLTITGNLFLDAGETGELIVPTVGDYTVLAMGVRSNLVLATGSDPAVIATEVVDQLNAETYDGRTFADILPDLLAMAAGRIVEGPTNVYKFYERNNTTVRYTLTKTGSERVRS